MPKGRPTKKTRPEIGERIALARVAVGLTQEELAFAMGVSQRVVTYWEREAVTLRANQLAKLARILETTMEHLVGHVPMEAGDKPSQRTMQVLERLRSLPARRQTVIVRAVEGLVKKAEKP